MAEKDDTVTQLERIADKLNIIVDKILLSLDNIEKSLLNIEIVLGIVESTSYTYCAICQMYTDDVAHDCKTLK